MILYLFAALALSQSPADTLRADAAAIGRDLVDGQVCEAVHGGSMQDSHFTTYIETLYTRTEELQLARSVVDDAAEQAYTAYLAEFEARYPGEPSDENIAEIRAHCQNLILTRPEMLGQYQAD